MQKNRMGMNAQKQEKRRLEACGLFAELSSSGYVTPERKPAMASMRRKPASVSVSDAVSSSTEPAAMIRPMTSRTAE